MGRWHVASRECEELGSMGVVVVLYHPSFELIRESTPDFVHEIVWNGFAVVDNAHSECVYRCDSSFVLVTAATTTVMDPPRDAN